jgi:hypothetical protein
VELINIGTAAVDIGGWTMLDSENSGGGRPFTFAQPTVIQPGTVFTVDTGSAAGQFDFGLGDNDTVRIFNGTTLVDSHMYSGAVGSTSRCPDGTGDFAVGTRTKNALNACGTDGGSEAGTGALARR